MKKMKKSLIVEVAHLLNALRLEKMANGEDLSTKDEETFWKLIDSLSKRDRESVIN